MKSFEDWEIKQPRFVVNRIDPLEQQAVSMNLRKVQKDSREEDWREALKWIYSEGALSQSDLAGTVIKKELES